MLTPAHKRWNEFVAHLEGEDGCNFRRSGLDNTIMWECNGDETKPKAREIMKDMGFSQEEIDRSCKLFEILGAYCDCEILFVVEKAYSKYMRIGYTDYCDQTAQDDHWAVPGDRTQPAGDNADL